MKNTNGTTINEMPTREETRYDMDVHETDTAKTGEVKTYAICPVSGFGKPPEEWSYCVGHCSIYDATTGLCGVNALGNLRFLPSIAEHTGDAADALLTL